MSANASIENALQKVLVIKVETLTQSLRNWAKTAITSKMKLLVTTVDKFQSQTVFKKGTILDSAMVLVADVVKFQGLLLHKHEAWKHAMYFSQKFLLKLVEKKEQLVSENDSHCGYIQRNVLDVGFLL